MTPVTNPTDPKQLRKVAKFLDETRYVVKCLQCPTVFWNVPLTDALAMFESKPPPQRWFVEAGRHWVNSGHNIIVQFKYPTEDQFILSLSAAWEANSKNETVPDLKKGMLEELGFLEKNLRSLGKW